MSLGNCVKKNAPKPPGETRTSTPYLSSPNIFRFDDVEPSRTPSPQPANEGQNNELAGFLMLQASFDASFLNTR